MKVQNRSITRTVGWESDHRLFIFPVHKKNLQRGLDRGRKQLRPQKRPNTWTANSPIHGQHAPGSSTPSKSVAHNSLYTSNFLILHAPHLQHGHSTTISHRDSYAPQIEPKQKSSTPDHKNGVPNVTWLWRWHCRSRSSETSEVGVH